MCGVEGLGKPFPQAQPWCHKCPYYLCTPAHAQVPHMVHVGVRGQFTGVGSFLLPVDCEDRTQVPLPAVVPNCPPTFTYEL